MEKNKKKLLIYCENFYTSCVILDGRVMVKVKMRWLINLLLCLSLLIGFSNSAFAGVIKRIDISGNERISRATIESYLSYQIGDSYNQSRTDQVIKNLFGTGFFADIKIVEHNGVLTVRLEENPQINKIGFEGNKRISDADILKEINMNERSVFSSAKLQNDVKRIAALYQKRGRYTVKIEPKIIKLDQNRINLVYEIEEGIVAKIQKITFVGNSYFSADKLSRVIISREERWYRFFSNIDVHHNEKFIADQELLRLFYLNEGFADFEVTSAVAELSPRRDAFLLTFVINEGNIYKLGESSIESKIPNLNTDELKTLIQFKTGDTFNYEELQSSVDKITDYLGDKGYAFVDVDYQVRKDKENKIAYIKFIINESVKVYINKIDIRNNTRTLDKVIRREFRLAEGDPYNVSKIARSKQKVKNLGFFNNVEFKNVKTENPDTVDIDVEVEEKSTGAINLAAGYNTSSGPLAMVSLSESNFLGKGQEVGVSIAKAKKSTDLAFSFTEPYFLDYHIAAGFDIFANRQDREKESSFRSQAKGITLRVGYDLTEHLYHGIRYSLKNEKINGIGSSASRFIKQQEGKHIVSLIGHTLTYDKLDDRLEPTKGYILKLSQDLAGLGGNSKYLDQQLSGTIYYPVYKRDVILSAQLKGGNISGFGNRRVKIGEHYFLGPDDIRGFDNAGLGPRDKATGDALGGRTFYKSTVELTFPLGFATEYGLKGHVFHDIGTVFNPDISKQDRSLIYNDKNLRATYGIGIRWSSVIGNIKLDYGVPYLKKRYDEKKHFNISFGAGTIF